MQKYNHLDLQDRHEIKALLNAGHSKTKIAQIVGVHKSTISRELTRNVAARGRYAKQYRPQVSPAGHHRSSHASNPAEKGY